MTVMVARVPAVMRMLAGRVPIVGSRNRTLARAQNECQLARLRIGQQRGRPGRRARLQGRQGIAAGLDRLVMLMAGAQSIREVMAFPKTQTASCPLTNAPGEVDEQQLREVGIRLRRRPAEEG